MFTLNGPMQIMWNVYWFLNDLQEKIKEIFLRKGGCGNGQKKDN
jgi:hypothetical protein